MKARPPVQRRELTRTQSWGVRALLVALMAGIGLFGFGGGSADALFGIHLPCPFSFNGAPGSPDPRSVNNSLVLDLFAPGNAVMATGGSAAGDGLPGNPNGTAYERYGSAGLYWSGTGTNCWGAVNASEDGIGNAMLSISTSISDLTTGLYGWASSPNLFDGFLQPVKCMISGCNGTQGLKGAIFLQYLDPIIVLAAIWGAWVGLLRRRATEAAQGGLWVFALASFALIVFNAPTAIVGSANSLVNNINSSVMNGITSATSTTGTAGMCNTSGAMHGTRMATCAIWEGLAFTPWANGQFGVGMGTALPATPHGTNNPMAGLMVVRFGGFRSQDLRLIQLDSQTAIPGVSTDADKTRWGLVADEIYGSSNYGAASFLSGKIQQYPQLSSTWIGDDGMHRVMVGFTAVLAAMANGTMIIVVSFFDIVYGLAFLMLFLFAPLFLLVGLHPAMRKVALKWLELVLGTVVKRVALGVYLAILVGMYQIIIDSPLSWMEQNLMILAVMIAGLLYRKQVMEAFNIVNLGGGGLDGNTQRQGRGMRNAVAGGVMGGIGGFMAGEGFKDAMGGAWHGTRQGWNSGGSAVRAGSVGHSAGSAHGNRQGSQREQQTRNRDAEAARAAAAERTQRQSDADTASDKLRLDPYNQDERTRLADATNDTDGRETAATANYDPEDPNDFLENLRNLERRKENKGGRLSKAEQDIASAAYDRNERHRQQRVERLQQQMEAAREANEALKAVALQHEIHKWTPGNRR